MVFMYIVWMVGVVIDFCIISLLNEKVVVFVRLVLGLVLLVYCNYGFVINGDVKFLRVELILIVFLMCCYILWNLFMFVLFYWEKIGWDDFKWLKEVKDLCYIGS